MRPKRSLIRRSLIRKLLMNGLTTGLLTLGVLGFTGCGSSSTTTDSGGDKGTTSDTIAGDDSTTGDDSGGDSSTSTSAHQTVVNVILVPETKNDYAQDVNGDGPIDNKIGQIIGTVDSAVQGKLNLQEGVAKEMEKGTVLVLLDLDTDSLVSSQSATLTAYQGEDTDGVPLNNYSGSAVLKVSSTAATPKGLQGTITNSKFSGTGEFNMVVPLVSQDPITVKLAKVEADIEANKLRNGKIAGAIPMSDINDKILPEIAATFYGYYTNPPAGFDKNLMESIVKEKTSDVCPGAATVCEQSIIDFAKSILSADIDTDNDQVNDAVSIGLGFESIACTIQK